MITQHEENNLYTLTMIVPEVYYVQKEEHAIWKLICMLQFEQTKMLTTARINNNI